MTDFFEKLKKGMDTKNVPEIPETPVEPVEPAQPEEPKEPKQPEEPKTEPDLAVAPIEDEVVEEEPEVKPKKKRKTTKKAKKEKKPAKKKIEIKAPVSVEDFSEPKEEPDLKEEGDWLDQDFGQLTVDLYQTDKEVVVQSAVAGVEPEDLDISIEDDLLIIKGKREKRFAQEKKNYFYQECFWGQFSREIILPVEVDSSQIEASMDQGVLTIRVPKIETETKKRIKIKS
jgi:HSP20 family protein